MQRECLPKGFKQNLEFLETMKVALRVMLDALDLSNTSHLALLGSKYDFKKFGQPLRLIYLVLLSVRYPVLRMASSRPLKKVTRHSLSFQFIQAFMHGVI